MNAYVIQYRTTWRGDLLREIDIFPKLYWKFTDAEDELDRLHCEADNKERYQIVPVTIEGLEYPR